MSKFARYVSCIAYAVLWGGPPNASAETRPNIVVIMTDNQGYGDAVFATYWEDPDFDATRPAFYYVRVIEIPTPRWTAYDVKRLGSKFPAGARMIIQDRAYTSPIWYTP